MHAEAETIRKMSETLESANFTRDQSDAFIQSIALAMKTFAVTPQVLDDRLEKQRREWKEDLGQVNKNLAEQKKSLEELKKTDDELKDTMHDLKRSLLNYLLGFTLAIFAGLMGILGAILAS